MTLSLSSQVSFAYSMVFPPSDGRFAVAVSVVSITEKFLSAALLVVFFIRERSRRRAHALLLPYALAPSLAHAHASPQDDQHQPAIPRVLGRSLALAHDANTGQLRP